MAQNRQEVTSNNPSAGVTPQRGFWGTVKEGLLQVDAAVRATANFVTFGMADKLAAAGDSAVSGKKIDETTAEQAARTAYDNKHRANAVAVGEALGVAATVATGTVAAKAAVKGTVAAAKATAQTARATVAAGTMGAAATAAESGVALTTSAIVRETARVAAKEAARATTKVTAKTALTATAGAATVVAMGGAGELAKSTSTMSDEDKKRLKEAGIDGDKIEAEMRRQDSVLITGGAGAVAATAAGGLTLLARATPLGRLATGARALAVMAGITSATTVGANVAAEGMADAEEAIGISHEAGNATLAGGAALGVAGAAAVPQARSWIGSKVSSVASALKGAGWLGRLGTVGGVAFAADNAITQVTSVTSTASGIREARAEAAKLEEYRAGLADGRIPQEAVAEPSAPEAVAAAPVAPEGSVTPVYNEHAERPAPGKRPAVTVAAPSRVVGGSGLQIPETPAGTLRVTQAGIDGFGQGAPVMAAAPEVHYDAFGSVIPQPESQMAAASPAAPAITATLPAPPAAAETVDLGGVLDARLQLGPNGPAAKVESVPEEEVRMAARRNPSSPGLA